MGEILNSLGVHWQSLLAQIVNFTILAFVLFKFAIKPALSSLDSRVKMQEKIAEGSKDIDKKLEEIKEKEKEMLALARKNSEKIIKDTEDAAISIKKKLVSDAESVAEKIVKDAQAKILQEQNKRDQELKKEIKNIVADAIEATVGKYLDSSAKAKLLEEAHKETLKVESFVK